MKQIIGLLFITSTLLIRCSPSKRLVTDTKQWKLVWADEFEYEGLPDSTKWNYDVGTACDKPAGCGWGNNELQYYTENRLKNAQVKDGKLLITAIKEAYKEERQYTSARLTTQHKGDWRYGKIEIRAKLPRGAGTWAALWMLSTEWKYGGWPESGEIDIMEHVGYEPETIHGTVHTKAYNHGIGTQKGGLINSSKPDTEFQNYVLEWSEEKIDWFVDGKHYFTFQNDKTGFKAWPFDQKFHLILNLAVGGNWGGSKGVDDTIWPRQMEVDYVRVYQ